MIGCKVRERGLGRMGNPKRKACEWRTVLGQLLGNVYLANLPTAAAVQSQLPKSRLRGFKLEYPRNRFTVNCLPVPPTAPNKGVIQLPFMEQGTRKLRKQTRRAYTSILQTYSFRSVGLLSPRVCSRSPGTTASRLSRRFRRAIWDYWQCRRRCWRS